MTRYDRVMAALEHPTQHSSEQGYPEPSGDDYWPPGYEWRLGDYIAAPGETARAAVPCHLVEERTYVYDLAFGLWCHIDPDGRRYPVQVLSII